MSNIPEARRLLKEVIASYGYVDTRIAEALALMDRKKPKVRATKRSPHPALTDEDKRLVDKWRGEGLAQCVIAARLGGIHPGRISEYENG
jgi:hypothetical protein